jgi:hypothetical protein
MAYTCALLTYEVGITTFLPILLLAWTNKTSNRNFIIKITPYILVTALYLGLCLVLRTYQPPGYGGVQLGTLSKFWNGFFAQLTSPLPLSYWILEPSRWPHFSLAFKNFWVHHNTFQLILFFAFFFITARIISHLLHQFRLTQKQRENTFIGGICFTLIPAILMGLSSRYQAELHLGYGYLPVYIQYTGVIFIFLSLFRKKNTRFSSILGFLFSLLTCIALILNMYTIQERNETDRFPRTLVEEALHHQLLENVPNGSIIFEKPTPWSAPGFYMHNANINVKSVLNRVDATKLESTQDSKFFIAYEHIPHSNDGFVIFGTLKTATQQNQTIDVIIENPKIFVLFENTTNQDKIISMLKSRLIINEIHIDQKDKNWEIVNLPVGQYLFRPETPDANARELIKKEMD